MRRLHPDRQFFVLISAPILPAQTAGNGPRYAAIRLGNNLSQSVDFTGFFFYAGHGVHRRRGELFLSYCLGHQ